ncbi:MAG: TatD family hydrolase [Candidatus Micrarchaeaceae archaeon]
MRYIDAHCHLNLFDSPLKAMAESEVAGVDAVVCSGDSAKDCAECLSLADSKRIFATIGIGPGYACKDFEFIRRLEELASTNKGKVVGIGEIGLDLGVARSGICDMGAQENAFIKQIETAKSLDLPVVVHSRNTIKRVIEIMRSERPAKAMFHFFEGNEEQAKELAAYGYVISIPPFLDRRRKNIISLLELNNIVVETDSPAAGRSPAEAVKLVGEIAKIKGISQETAARKIAQTIRNLYGI